MGLKKANACISLLLVVVFLAHSVYELIACLTMSFDPTVVKVFGITVAAFVSVHVVLSVISIFKYQDSKKIDYPKLNKRTWLQRFSAVMIVVLLPLHMRTAGWVMAEGVTALSIALEILQVIFFALVYLHIAVSFSRALLTLGWITEERTKRRIDLVTGILCGVLFLIQSVVIFVTFITAAGMDHGAV